MCYEKLLRGALLFKEYARNCFSVVKLNRYQVIRYDIGK